jgi:hypothetical protein
MAQRIEREAAEVGERHVLAFRPMPIAPIALHREMNLIGRAGVP